MMLVMVCVVFFFKQKTAYEVRISDWSSDVCSSDLNGCGLRLHIGEGEIRAAQHGRHARGIEKMGMALRGRQHAGCLAVGLAQRSEEHTSELQSLMRISYAVFCLKKKKHRKDNTTVTDNSTNTHKYMIDT